jgi:flagellin
MSDVSLSKAVRSNLLSLQNTASMMSKTQERLATGNKVNSALDNPSNFFTASALNARAGDMGSLLDSMASGVKTIEAASNGITALTKTVESMQSTLRQARQDKSFQSDTFEVTADSTIKINGGQFDAAQSIALQAPTGGTKASLTTTAVYANPTLAAGETAGPQTLVKYDASLAGTIVKVDGFSTTALAGANQAAIMTDLQTKLDAATGTSKYIVAADTVDATKISIQARDTQAASPSVEFGSAVVKATQGVTEIDYNTATIGSVTAGGQAISTGGSFEDFVAGLKAKETAGGYTVTADAATKKIKLTAVAYNTAAPATVGITGGTTTTAGTAGVFTSKVAAATDDLKITYGTQSADIKIVAGTTAERTKQVNDQLKMAGINDVEASFDAAGKLTIASKTEEAKTLAISGTNATVFGSATVATGSAAVSGYKSSNTVDQFVEEINRNPSTAGKVRASNDNGKLRLENLSTKELGVSFDKDGAGVGSPVDTKISGNVIRENLSKQFNELRDQLDKLSDDASFNGINLLRGDKLTITFNESGSSSIDIQAKDPKGNERAISAANLSISSLVGEDLDTDGNIDKLLGNLSTALGTLRSQASSFGSNLSSVENRQNFTKSMVNTLQTGAANLTLADTNEEAANLLALQTRQQLASSALSMASQADQAVLRLF